MRVTRLRPTVASLLTLAVVLQCGTGGPAAAAEDAGTPPQIRDARGDANGVNGQGLTDSVPRDVVTDPASVGSLDILTARLSSYGRFRHTVVRGRRVRTFTPEGFTVTLELAEPPRDGAAYRVRGETESCDTFMFQYQADTLVTGGYLRHTCTDSETKPDDFVDVPVQVTIEGRTVVWRVALGQLPKQVPLGTIVGDLVAETLGDPGAVTIPVVDNAFADVTYRVGQPG